MRQRVAGAEAQQATAAATRCRLFLPCASRRRQRYAALAAPRLIGQPSAKSHVFCHRQPVVSRAASRLIRRRHFAADTELSY